MRLVITGAGGFLGRNALLDFPRDWQIAALHRPGDESFRSFLQARGLAHIIPVACDLTDAEQVAQAAHTVGSEWDSCLYLASNTSIPLSIERPVFDLTTNTIGLLNFLEHWSCDHVVYLSSGAVYMGLSGRVGVTTPVAPPLPYAISKLASEHYIQAFMRHCGRPHRATIVRFFGAFGPYEPARKLYTKLVRRYAFERNPTFTITGDGGNYIDAMYVSDAVRALRLLLGTPPEGVHLVDLGMGGGETVNELALRAAHVFGIEPVLEHVGASPEYITFAIDPDVFARQYDFAPTVSVEEGFQLLAAHLKQEDERATG